jgi:putative alpha-1,2-mannosidase
MGTTLLYQRRKSQRGPFRRTYLTHQEIVRGGEISFDMASAQDYKWASGPEARPPSPMRQQQGPTGK